MAFIPQTESSSAFNSLSGSPVKSQQVTPRVHGLRHVFSSKGVPTVSTSSTDKLDLLFYVLDKERDSLIGDDTQRRPAGNRGDPTINRRTVSKDGDAQNSQNFADALRQNLCAVAPDAIDARVVGREDGVLDLADSVRLANGLQLNPAKGATERDNTNTTTYTTATTTATVTIPDAVYTPQAAVVTTPKSIVHDQSRMSESNGNGKRVRQLRPVSRRKAKEDKDFSPLSDGSDASDAEEDDTDSDTDYQINGKKKPTKAKKYTKATAKVTQRRQGAKRKRQVSEDDDDYDDYKERDRSKKVKKLPTTEKEKTPPKEKKRTPARVSVKREPKTEALADSDYSATCPYDYEKSTTRKKGDQSKDDAWRQKERERHRKWKEKKRQEDLEGWRERERMRRKKWEEKREEEDPEGWRQKKKEWNKKYREKKKEDPLWREKERERHKKWKEKKKQEDLEGWKEREKQRFRRWREKKKNDTEWLERKREKEKKWREKKREDPEWEEKERERYKKWREKKKSMKAEMSEDSSHLDAFEDDEARSEENAPVDDSTGTQ